MKIFHCDNCGQLLFFENTNCVSCGRRAAYLPDLQLVASLEQDGDGTWRRKTYIKRFYVITGGVFLACLAGACLLIATATPGLKLLVILVCLFVFFRLFVVVRW